jgi:hypothetical protein
LTVASTVAAGTYNFTVNAANGTTPNATQAFTLTVAADPTSNDVIAPIGMLKAWTQGGTLYVSGLPAGAKWSTYTIAGTLIYQGTADAGATLVIVLPARGIYIFRSGGSVIKVAN